jgi:hypothetical protein
VSPRRPAAEIVDALAAGLAAHVRDLERAEASRAAFAFDERPRPLNTRSARDGRHHAAAALAVACDPIACRLLARLRGSPLPLADLVTVVSDRSDGVAAAEVVNGLAAAGLVARELTTDEVRLTSLGEAIVDLVAELADRLGGHDPEPAEAAASGADR